MKQRLTLLLALTILLVLPIHAQLVEEGMIGFTEKTGNYLPDSLTIVDEKADTILLSTLLNKPTILSLVYYRCPGICSPLMSGIARAIDQSELLIDEDYQVLTISFSPSENTALAVNKKQNYLNSMKRVDATKGWYFFTTDSGNIHQLTSAVGFAYQQQGKDYAHTAAIMAINEDGQIIRYLHGIEFTPLAFKMAITEAKINPDFSDKIWKFIIAYDTNEKQYVLKTFNLSLAIVLLIGLVFALILGVRKLVKAS